MSDFDIWKDIPFPENFTPQNSIVFIQTTGSVEDWHVTYKLSNNNTQYCAHSIQGTHYKPRFIFIKCLSN